MQVLLIICEQFGNISYRGKSLQRQYRGLAFLIL